MNDVHRVNVALMTSANYNLEYFARCVFLDGDPPEMLRWDTEPNPACSVLGTDVPIKETKSSGMLGLRNYEQYLKLPQLSQLSQLAHLSHLPRAKTVSVETDESNKTVLATDVEKVPLMLYCLSPLTFSSDSFRKYALRKVDESEILLMFYRMDKQRTLHDLIHLYTEYVRGEEDLQHKTIIMIGLNYSQQADYVSGVDLSEQVNAFISSIDDNATVHHISIDVGIVPRDIYNILF